MRSSHRDLIVVTMAACSVAALVVCIVQLSACGETSHIFQGRFFVPQRNCLGTTSSVDVVSGEPPANPCAPACLTQPLGDGGRSIYVSTMCAPYPFAFDASASDPLCPSALEAFARDDTCSSDGGSSHPLDAGAPPEPPIDAAPSDATTD